MCELFHGKYEYNKDDIIVGFINILYCTKSFLAKHRKKMVFISLNTNKNPKYTVAPRSNTVNDLRKNKCVLVLVFDLL